MFFPSRARLVSWRPPMQRRGNLENSSVPTLLSRGSRLVFRATMCRAEGDLEACWNRILTIFVAPPARQNSLRNLTESLQRFPLCTVDSCAAANWALFDDLVSANEHDGRYFEADCLRSLTIY